MSVSMLTMYYKISCIRLHVCIKYEMVYCMDILRREVIENQGLSSY